jgi:hypothetical protein
MSIKGDIDRAKAQATAQLNELTATYNKNKAILEARIKDLDDADKLVTPQLEAVVTRLGVILGKN